MGLISSQEELGCKCWGVDFFFFSLNNSDISLQSYTYTSFWKHKDFLRGTDETTYGKWIYCLRQKYSSRMSNMRWAKAWVKSKTDLHSRQQPGRDRKLAKQCEASFNAHTLCYWRHTTSWPVIKAAKPKGTGYVIMKPFWQDTNGNQTKIHTSQESVFFLCSVFIYFAILTADFRKQHQHLGRLWELQDSWKWITCAAIAILDLVGCCIIDHVHVSTKVTTLFPKPYVTTSVISARKDSQALARDRAMHCKKIRKDRWLSDQVPECLPALKLS